MQRPGVQDLNVYLNKALWKWEAPESVAREIAVAATATDTVSGKQIIVRFTFKLEPASNNEIIDWDQFININELQVLRRGGNGDRKGDITDND
jgi:hypothetical protein